MTTAGLDRASALRLVRYVVAHEEASLGRGLYAEEVTWAMNQGTAIVGEVAALLDALVAAGTLALRAGMYTVADTRPHRKDTR
jgi:2-keto-3-deoxy-6-phosphogluconate aldolase